jgi:hypothetical protein
MRIDIDSTAPFVFLSPASTVERSAGNDSTIFEPVVHSPTTSRATRRARRALGALAIVIVGGLASTLNINAAPTIQSIDGPALALEQAERGSQVRIGAAATARYRVTLVVEWSGSTHPNTLPSGWHTSPAVVVSHSSTGDLFQLGGFATSGIESMAETGNTSTLQTELVASPTVEEFAIGGGISGSGNDTLEIKATQSGALLSLVTMLAPSPDWFVGFPAVELFHDGKWVDRVDLDLVVYDAGTDSGTTFTAANFDTQPRLPISGPRDNALTAAANEGRFGFVVIERIG